MSDTSSDTTKHLQLEIVPQRLLRPETAQALLNEILDLDGVVRLFVHGPRLPGTVPYGPAKGIPLVHDSRRLIEIEGKTVELMVSVGSIRLEVTDANVKEQVHEICEKILPFPFEFREGNFMLRRQTVSGYARFGPDQDPLMVGITDPKGKLKDQVCFIKDE
ncbi:MAG: Methyl-coenzyme M reductase II operon protein D [Methanomethylovorans sp. PtaU1.Bin093]|uniref:methyl-coenzyme M reductase operon protein D n=1 Tax=Methanomethylovorans sp. PtaU1.Bin093 TaxID=1811679 RepID=UPI0009D5418C|nr:methyl-coenzyme M reductase operon protein D [Methanomethylovorans sp. PtaU1.Bin093]OPY22168.1 MAG: Methyl-coenzyme M reductase II operon protein D [Methanomethylovorans sp. PtaU1.Bin093]